MQKPEAESNHFPESILNRRRNPPLVGCVELNSEG
jgi:hypothetical protein